MAALFLLAALLDPAADNGALPGRLGSHLLAQLLLLLLLLLVRDVLVVKIFSRLLWLLQRLRLAALSSGHVVSGASAGPLECNLLFSASNLSASSSALRS